MLMMFFGSILAQLCSRNFPDVFQLGPSSRDSDSDSLRRKVLFELLLKHVPSHGLFRNLLAQPYLRAQAEVCVSSPAQPYPRAQAEVCFSSPALAKSFDVAIIMQGSTAQQPLAQPYPRAQAEVCVSSPVGFDVAIITQGSTAQQPPAQPYPKPPGAAEVCASSPVGFDVAISVSVQDSGPTAQQPSTQPYPRSLFFKPCQV